MIPADPTGARVYRNLWRRDFSAHVARHMSRAESIAQISSLYALGHIMWGERLSEAIITQGRGLYKKIIRRKVTRSW
jgi:hypothetical protein